MVKKTPSPIPIASVAKQISYTNYIQRYIRLLGIPAKYKGHPFVIEAINLTLEDESRLQNMSKDIYPKIAKKFDSNERSVEKNIRTAINICWERGNTKLLSEMKGFEIRERPSNGEFIDILAAYIKTQLDNTPEPTPLSPVEENHYEEDIQKKSR